MGTHGRRGIRRLTPGSDAEMVVRHSPLPVLLVNQSPASRRSCSRSFSAAGLGAGVGWVGRRRLATRATRACRERWSVAAAIVLFMEYIRVNSAVVSRCLMMVLRRLSVLLPWYRLTRQPSWWEKSWTGWDCRMRNHPVACRIRRGGVRCHSQLGLARIPPLA